jgi:hypothetical protein
MPKPVPDTVAELIVRVALPVLEILMVCELVLPVTTLPKLALDGVTLIFGAGAVVPVPERETVF